MSEDNSTTDKQEQSIDQAAHLDSLIAQFEEDFDLDFADETDGTKPSMDDEADLLELDEYELDEPELDASELDESDLDELAILYPERDEAAAKPEQPDNKFGMLVGGLIAVAVIGIGIWPSSGDDNDKYALAKQPLATTTVAETPAPSKPAAGSDQQEAEPSEIAGMQKSGQIEAVKTALIDPPVVEPVPAEIQEPVAKAAASKREATVKPVSPKVVTAKQVSKSATRAWAVNLTSVSTLASAEEIQRGLSSKGVSREWKKVTIAGKRYYRIRMPGFASKAEAEQARLPLLKEREFRSAWLERYRVKSQ